MSAINVVDVTQVYRPLLGRSVQALSNVSLSLEEGEILTLLGPNGAGKTTLVKGICGLLLPTCGTIRIGQHDVVDQRQQALSRLGVILEGNRSFYYRLSAYENLEYFAYLRNYQGATSLKLRIEELLDFFGLADAKFRLVNSFSRGMLQRLALAAAVINEPEILVLDEPTLGLDVEGALEIERLLTELTSQGVSILMTTHQMDLAERISDRICILMHGQIKAEAPVHQFMELFAITTTTFLVSCKRDNLPYGILDGLDVDVEEVHQGTEIQLTWHSSDQLYTLVNRLSSDGLPTIALKSGELGLREAYMATIEANRESQEVREKYSVYS